MQTNRAIFLVLLLAFGQCRVQDDDDEDWDPPRREQIRSTIAPPRTDDGGPVVVHLGFYIESMGNFNPAKMTFDTDSYVSLSWKDRRLAHTGKTRTITTVAGLSKIWLPDLYFANAKKTQFQYVLTPNFALWILPDGTVSYSVRVSKRVACQFRFEEYPLDHQACGIRVLSYAHTTEDMLVRWFHPNPVTANPKIELTEFQVNRHIGTCYCDGAYKYQRTSERQLKGNFSCLIATIYLKREITYHLVQTYVPTAMIVGISWVSFWIDRSAVPARISLSFTTLLTLSTMAAGVRFALPPVSYAKAIDYWMGCCTFFVFAALLQFAVVNSYARKAAKYEKRAAKMEKQESMEYNKDLSAFYTNKAIKIDKVCRIAFPLLFLIFNLFYWLTYADVLGGADYQIRSAANLTCS